MKKYVMLAAAVACSVTLGAGYARAQNDHDHNHASAHAGAQHSAVSVSGAYAFAVPQGGRTGAVFLTLNYPAGGADIVPDRIIRAESPVAGIVELHTTLIEDGIMTMRKLEALPLPPTGEFILKPQGAHIMLLDLQQGLEAGGKFPLTLVFEKAGNVTVEVDIRKPGDQPAATESHDQHHHGHSH